MGENLPATFGVASQGERRPKEKRFVVGPHYLPEILEDLVVRRRRRMVNKTSASFPSSTIQCGGVEMPAGVQRVYGFCPPLAPFSGVALSTGGLLFLA